MTDKLAVHASDCIGEECNGVYVCAGCERLCGWCFGAADEFYEYCDDCAEKIRAEILGKYIVTPTCVWCGHPASGNYSIHMDASMEGANLPLCDICGGNDWPSCGEIWERIRERGLVNLRQRDRFPKKTYDPNDESMFKPRKEVSEWFDEGVRKGATHMIVACDTFDYEDYPVYVMPGEDPRERATKLGDMQRLMEVYALHLNKYMQLGEHRSFHYEPPPAQRPDPNDESMFDLDAKPKKKRAQ